MNYPDKEHTLAILGDWDKHHSALERLMGGIEATIGLDPDGPMFETMWKLFDAYTDALSVEVGDFDGWLRWFNYENYMGANGMAAGYYGKTKPIKTLVHLYGLIAESRKRAQL